MAKKYSVSERKAYHMGRAFATAKKGGRVKCPDEKTRQSFRNGLHSVEVGKSAKTVSSNCGSPLYVVDGDGVVVKVLHGGKAK